MKVHRQIKLFVPSSIMTVIDANNIEGKEYCLYLIHYIIYKPIRDKRFNDFVPLNKVKLKEVIGSKLSNYIKILEKYELIESDNQAIRGKKTFYYRINPKHTFECGYFDLLPNTKLFKKLIQSINTERTNLSRLEPFLNDMRKEFMSLHFDYDNALKWIETVPEERKRISYAIAVNQIADVRFRYFKRNKTNNRLDTNLTNLKKDLRRFIVGGYVSIDLMNSQPFLLSYLFEKLAKILNYFHLKKIEINHNNKKEILNMKYLPYCIKNDLINLAETFGIKSIQKILLIRKNQEFAYFTNLSLFKKWVTEGNFYDEFVKEFGENLQRVDVKKIMFEVLFSKNLYFDNFKKFVPFEKEKQIFASVFPVIYEIIEILKDADNAKLPIYLQQLESRIFIDCIAKELVEAGIIPLTIHDSILIKEYQKEQSLNIIQTVFKREIGIVPAFHVEAIN